MKKLVTAMATLAGAWAGGSYLAVKAAYRMMFARSSLQPYSTDYRYEEIVEKHPGRYFRRSVKIPHGDYELQGYLYGKDTGKGLIIFSHGIFAGHESYIAGLLNLVDRGYLVLGFDNTGCCESPGDGIRGLPQGPLDLKCALDFVENDPELKDLPRFLYGHSWGGYSVCAVLNFTHRVNGVVSVSGFDTPMEVTEAMGSAKYSGIVKVTRPMILLENRKRFGGNANLSAVEGINSCLIPVMVMHGVGDTYVDYNSAGIIHHRDEITNPRVIFVPLDYPGRNGHNDIFLSAEAKEYLNQFEERIAEPKKKYKVKEYWQLPEEVKKEIFQDFDRDISTGVNLELMEEIDQFFQTCR